MTADRRALMRLLAIGATAPMLAPLLKLGDALARTPPAPDPEGRVGSKESHDALAAIPDLKMHGSEQIAMLLYPGFTALDLVGPHYMFACMMGATVHLVTPADNLAPIASDLGLAIAPTTTMENCPRDLDIVFAPGGLMGTLEAMQNKRIIDFIRDRAARAKHVTSVCTGSLILGQAGLLRGKRATCHWAGMESLPLFGAIPVSERVVTDGAITTGAGVSAGLDFGLALIGRLRGHNYARAIQLQAEYAPKPPYNAGTLETCPPEVAAIMTEMLAPFTGMVKAIAGKV
jgi:cyclohexyl-isocyanide hydratase